MTKPRPKSIQFRLTAWYTGILALTFALIGLGVWLALDHSIQKTADRELESRLVEVRRYFDGFSPDDLAHLEEEFREESLLGQSGANIRIEDANGKWLFQTPGTENWHLEHSEGAVLPASGRFTTIVTGGRSFRILTAPVRLGVAQIGLPVEEFEEVRTDFLWLSLWGSPILLALAWSGGYWMSGRALKPVDEISRAAASISANQLSARLPSRGSGDELDRLSGVLNNMLERLEAAFKRVTEFTADASHELRTPIAVIQTTAELMQTQPRTVAEHLSSWNRVIAETERTSSLISDLLTMARADAEQTNLEFQTVDLEQIVCSSVEEMSILAERHGVALVEHPFPPCQVRADADALRRVVCILLDNAIKYTPPHGEVQIEVKVHDQVEVAVSDTGSGIAADDLPLIFERFYRVSKDRSRKTGGAGLGLSIAKWIIEQHAGNIRAQSTPTSGSTFTLVLPKLSSE